MLKSVGKATFDRYPFHGMYYQVDDKLAKIDHPQKKAWQCHPFYAFATRHCWQKHYVFGLSVRHVRLFDHSIVQSYIVTTICHERLEQF